MHEEEYRPIDDFLRRFVARLRTVEGLEALCLAATALAVLAALGVGVDLVKERLLYAPLAFSVGSILILLALAGFIVYSFLRRRGLTWAARAIERQRPELRNNLINSLQLYPQLADPGKGAGVSAPMILALIRQTRAQIGDLQPADLVDTGPLRTKARVLALAAAPVIALALWHPGFPARSLALVAHPLEHLPPAEIFIHVVTRDVRVIRGTAVSVEAVTSGAQPEAVELAFRRPTATGGSEDGTVETVAMNTGDNAGGDNRYAAVLPEVTEDLDYRVVTGPFASPWYRITAVDRPVVTGLKVTLYPPHYTGLPNETFTGGNVRGIKGSTLSFSAGANKAMAGAVVALDDGREVPLKVTGDLAQGSLVLFRSQRYRIRIEDAFGFENLPVPYAMHAVPDGFPVVEMLKPSEDLEVNGDERIALEYRANDDYGLQEVTLVATIGEREERIPVWRAELTRQLQETFIWDLDGMRLEEGDVVVYHLEVLDNDTISGPKLGKSRPLSLRLKNLKAEHRQVAEMIRDISDKMVDLLGDHLEAPPDQPAVDEQAAGDEQAADRPIERLAEGLDRMMQRVDETMQRTREDRISDFATWSDLETLKRNLRHAREDLVERMRQAASPEEREQAHDAMATELERLSMLSEDVSRRLTGQDMADSARDMVKNQERFLDSLEKLRSGNKELDEVLEELSKLAQQLQELQASLAQFARQMPSEFVNPSSMRNMPFSDMRSMMEQIRQKLREGDIEGALQMAREMFNQMAQLAAMLRSGQQQAQGNMMSRMQGAMGQSSNELMEILQEQQDILLGTERTHKEIAGKIEEIRERATQELAAGAQTDLAVLEQLLAPPDLESDRQRTPAERERNEAIRGLLSGLRDMLKDRDFDTLSKRLGPATEELAGMGELDAAQNAALAMLTELARAYEAIAALPEPELTPEQKEATRSLATREDVLERRTQDLVDRLRYLFQLFPSLDPKIVNSIAEARESMGEARHELGSLRPGQAVPPEQQAINLLSQSSQQMQQAMQRLAQRGRFGRVPLMQVFRRGRFLPTGEFLPPTGAPQFPEHDIDENLTGLDTEKFKLPGKDDYRPDRFREEVLESLKEGVPEQFKEQIERYFRELSQ
ncbi:MAG: DUF4175 family protein [Deltaproteobacteria bacterium]|nr:DUF4175 family protein [Deltaproteobacteria bacterium]